jgi:hypothetical protein
MLSRRYGGKTILRVGARDLEIQKKGDLREISPLWVRLDLKKATLTPTQQKALNGGTISVNDKKCYDCGYQRNQFQK